MYYSGTIFTTIGYGDVFCLTVWGRIFTVVYAIVGIPIMLITLSHLGKFLYKWINALVAFYAIISKNVFEKFWPSKVKKQSLLSENKRNFLSKQSTIDKLTINGSIKEVMPNGDKIPEQHEQRVNFILQLVKIFNLKQLYLILPNFLRLILSIIFEFFLITLIY